MDQIPQAPKRLSDLIKQYERPNPPLDAKKKKRPTERGELLEFFTDKLNLTRDGKAFKKLKISRVAMLVSHLSVQDLYYLKSTCEDAQRRGNSFSKHFWWAIKPQETT